MAISARCWGSHHKQPTGHLHSCWTLQSCCSNKHPKLRWASERVKNPSHFNALRRGRKQSGERLGTLQEGRLTGPLGQVEVASGGEMDGPQQDPPWVPKHHPGAQHGKGHMHMLGLNFTFREVNTYCATGIMSLHLESFFLFQFVKFPISVPKAQCLPSSVFILLIFFCPIRVRFKDVLLSHSRWLWLHIGTSYIHVRCPQARDSVFNAHFR